MEVLDIFIKITLFAIGIFIGWIFIGVPFRAWRKKCNALKECQTNNTNLWNANINLEAKLRSEQKASGFTDDELVKMRFYLHPDRNNGKTSELFVKINDLVERK